MLSALLALVKDEEDANKKYYYLAIGRTENEAEILLYERIDAKFIIYTMHVCNDVDVPDNRSLLEVAMEALKGTEHTIEGIEHMKFLELTESEYNKIIDTLK